MDFYLKKEMQDYEKNPDKNLCIECKVDMGFCNPRQLCGKTYCASKRELSCRTCKIPLISRTQCIHCAIDELKEMIQEIKISIQKLG